MQNSRISRVRHQSPLFAHRAIFAATQQPCRFRTVHAIPCGAQVITAATHRLLADFFYPLVRLRDKVPGYAVSLVKAGVQMRGLDVGGVRPPLIDPPPDHLAELRTILDAGLAIAAP